MTIFHSYVSLPEGTWVFENQVLTHHEDSSLSQYKVVPRYKFAHNPHWQIYPP